MRAIYDETNREIILANLTLGDALILKLALRILGQVARAKDTAVEIRHRNIAEVLDAAIDQAIEHSLNQLANDLTEADLG